MNPVAELAADDFPDAVPFRALGDVGEFIRGRRFTKNDVVPDGLESIHYGEIYTHYGTSATSAISHVRADLAPQLRFAQPGDVVIAAVGETVEDVGKAVAWLGAGEVAVHDDCFVFRHELNPAFVAYWFQTSMLNAEKAKYVARAKVKRLSGESLAKLRIPVPPLEVQERIVGTLDRFTRLEAELEVVLERELEARESQHERYRELILSPSEDAVRWTTLGDICLRVSSGGTPLANLAEYYSNGTIPWLRTQEVRFVDIHDTAVKITEKAVAETSAKWIPANCVIVAISGASAGRSAINKIPLTTNQHCCNLQVDPEQADFRYVFHWLARHYEPLRGRGRGARADLNGGLIKSFPIAVPPLAEQERIVTILNRLDALAHGLSDALPNEAEFRRLQYEHYRDRVLTFEEAT